LSPPTTKAPAPLPFYLAWLKNDKVHHFTAYGILAGLLLGATQWNAAIVLFAAAVHGGSMEILQQWFPPRSMELTDWIADVAGATTFLLVHRFLPRRRSD
jgi:VanZ family protein